MPPAVPPVPHAAPSSAFPFVLETREADQGVIRVVARAKYTLLDVEHLIREIEHLADRPAALRVMFVDPEPWPSLSAAHVRGAANLTEARLLPAGLTAVAIVAPRDAVFGVARMFAAFGEMVGIRAAVFRDEPGAMTWLARERR